MCENTKPLYLLLNFVVNLKLQFKKKKKKRSTSEKIIKRLL